MSTTTLVTHCGAREVSREELNQIEVRHTDEQPSRAERKQDEHAVLREILAEHNNREDRARVWTERTGKSERAFYRRLAEIQ